MKVGIHFIRRRILQRAEAHDGRAKHSSVFRCADGFEAIRAASVGGSTEFVVWDEQEPAEDFVRRVDVLVGIPDIRLFNARERTGHRPPYLLLVMGDATRAIPFSQTIMSRLQPDDTLVCSCADDVEILGLFLDAPSGTSIARAPMPGDLSAFVPRSPLPPAAELELRRFAADRPVILSAERLKPGKGVHRVVPLAGYLRDTGHDPIVVFLGASATAAKTAYEQEIEDELARQGLADSWFMLPFLDAGQLAAMYARATFVVSTSTIYDNNFGYVPIESMVAATPPIASDWGGYRDAVLDGVTGLRMPTTLEADGRVTLDHLPAAVAAAELLADEQRYAEISRAGQRHVEENFSIPAVLRLYSELALAAVERKTADLPPWRINDLGRTAIAAGWTDQTDNAERTARLPRKERTPSADYHRINQLIYTKYATRVKETIDG